MTEDKRVEFIESFIKLGNGDYQWNDNHGELIRCKNCKNYSGDGMYCGWNMIASAEGFCFHANEKPECADD